MQQRRRRKASGWHAARRPRHLHAARRRWRSLGALAGHNDGDQRFQDAASDNALIAHLPPLTPAIVDDAVPTGFQRLPSHAVADLGDASRERFWEGDAYAFVSVATDDVRGRAPTIEQPHMPAFLADLAYPRVYPANPPPSPRTDARRRIMTSIFMSTSSRGQRGQRGHRADMWNPTALGLSNGLSNGMTSSSGLPGGSSSEEEDGASGTSMRRR